MHFYKRPLEHKPGKSNLYSVSSGLVQRFSRSDVTFDDVSGEAVEGDLGGLVEHSLLDLSAADSP